MKISIITICYNNADTLGETMESVLGQTYANIEYIIIDGASTDRTPDIIKKHREDIDVFVSKPDKGPYDAMNKGIKRATGDIVGFLHAGDVFFGNDVIASVADEFKNSNINACWGDLWYVDKYDLNKITREWKSGLFSKKKLKNGWHPPHPALYLRRDLYEKCGYFDLRFPIAADYEFMLRLFAAGDIQGSYIPKVLVKMREGGLSSGSILNIIKANMEVYRAWKKNGLVGGFRAALVKPISKLFQLRS